MDGNTNDVAVMAMKRCLLAHWARIYLIFGINCLPKVLFIKKSLKSLIIYCRDEVLEAGYT